MAHLKDIVSWLDHELDVERVHDVAVNGLQVEGRSEVQRVVTGVSANLALLQAAVDRKADLVVVHHGLVWGGIQRITGPLRTRIRLVLEQELSLAAYHLPLDMHPVHGNNAGLASSLELQDVQPFGLYKGQLIGLRGQLAKPLPIAEVLARIRSRIHDQAQLLPGGEHPVHRVAVCSGGAAELVWEAIEAGCDLFVSGEATEFSPALAAEGRIHVVVAGHHATERSGVQALARALQQHFGIPSEFVDIPNAL
ncbi:MAG: Nif3-like dinuclear metal center hexameric protein [Pseudomonadota bacterium]